MWESAKLSLVAVAALLPCRDHPPAAGVPVPPFEICTTGGVQPLPSKASAAANAHHNHPTKLALQAPN